MTPQEDIVQAHPNHFTGPRYIECGNGWNRLIVDFIEELDKIPGGKELTFFCIKEKFGRIRFDFNDGYPREVSELESKYETLSEQTCEVCGRPGKNMEIRNWIRTACEEHAK